MGAVAGEQHVYVIVQGQRVERCCWHMLASISKNLSLIEKFAHLSNTNWPFLRVSAFLFESIVRECAQLSGRMGDVVALRPAGDHADAGFQQMVVRSSPFTCLWSVGFLRGAGGVDVPF